ncbi:DUF736 domain-containing protein [Rubrimonas cliftonensis]|uniref:Uncharacterized conserved protein, DUF736 family n=1 Tax=Rubrimonas cliftonensis TaxID=89524 RepID=A0A1H4ESB5_9RHOB|nr:DUF736 domain-containing protein [Rubrimonas cliftonensis]SEA87807.1 Uncharacterized conserved protein, DUF736 family [Rubrimonas cliftonensis]
MATLGIVTRRPADGAITGKLEMKSYTGRVLFAPATKRSDAAPDFRIYGESAGGGRFEMGAAWTKTRTDGQGTYVSVKLDYPELPAPIYATLGQLADQDDDDVLAVIWNRPDPARAGAAGDPFARLANAA